MNTKNMLGARIKELRKAKGLTQEKLSEVLEIDPKHLSRIEVGKSYPSFEVLEKATTALQIEIKDFFEFEHQVGSVKDLKKEITSLLKEADIDKMRMVLKIVRAIVR